MLGRELLKARQAAGMTQEDLAFRAGVHRTYISYLEHDKYSPSVDMLFRVCDAPYRPRGEAAEAPAVTRPPWRAEFALWVRSRYTAKEIYQLSPRYAITLSRRADASFAVGAHLTSFATTLLQTIASWGSRSCRGSHDPRNSFFR